MNYHFIAVEGNIGAGKTTLTQKLAEHYHAKLILEQFAHNPFLPLFYQDKERYAFPLELSFLADRYDQLKENLLSPGAENEIIIADYTIIKSQLFARNNLPSNEYELFLKMADIMKTTLPKPDLLIYLHAPIATLQRQIQKRGRPYEQNIQDAYLEEIERAYLQFLDQEDMNILTIDTNHSDFNREPDFQSLIRFLESDVVAGKHKLST
jgi:deoxyguanosine kinase